VECNYGGRGRLDQICDKAACFNIWEVRLLNQAFLIGIDADVTEGTGCTVEEKD
jgi:hypothetical protein